jgi:iron(III) transport system substrate-binding protein
VVATSDAKADAQDLLEWLATDGQTAFIGGNHEYPVNPDVEPDEVAASFGPYTPMSIDAEAYGSLNADATALLAEAGYE